WWDLEKNRVVRTYEFPSNISAVAVSPDGKRVAVAGSAEPLCPQPIHVWDLDGQQMRSMQGHDINITRLAFTPDGKRLFSANLQQQINHHNRAVQVPGLIVEWDIATGKSLRSRQHRAEALAPSSDGAIWALRETHSEILLLDWQRQNVYAQVDSN